MDTFSELISHPCLPSIEVRREGKHERGGTEFSNKLSNVLLLWFGEGLDDE